MTNPQLAPGQILQNMYLKKKLKKRNLKSFIEVGSGAGFISNLLLNLGLNGTGYDLNPSANEKNQILNRDFIAQKKYKVINQSFFENNHQKVDLIISSMVLEHLSDDDVKKYFKQCEDLLLPEGKVIFLVPASLKHWGVEDEIAGHLRRYSPNEVPEMIKDFDFKIDDLTGLTYPLSNWLFPLSNFLVKKSESRLLSKDHFARTVESGSRNVWFKTRFPGFLKVFINEITLSPFYFLQVLNKNNPSCLVLYCELSRKSDVGFK